MARATAPGPHRTALTSEAPLVALQSRRQAGLPAPAGPPHQDAAGCRGHARSEVPCGFQGAGTTSPGTPRAAQGLLGGVVPVRRTGAPLLGLAAALAPAHKHAPSAYVPVSAAAGHSAWRRRGKPRLPPRGACALSAAAAPLLSAAGAWAAPSPRRSAPGACAAPPSPPPPPALCEPGRRLRSAAPAVPVTAMCGE